MLASIVRLIGVFALCISSVAAASLPNADPASVGLSGKTLARLDAAIRTRIEDGAFPGAITMIVRHGKLAHLSMLGARRDGGVPMSEDTLFRIYSMTKPIVSVAAMTLVEAGRLRLDEPIEKYLPEFGRMRVAVARTPDGTIETEAAKRAITVRDLLRHTAGLTYGFFGTGPARDALRASAIGWRARSNRELVASLAALPLEHQPGSAWEYSRATDVLGALLEVVDGRPLGELLAARVLGPLGMTSTSFQVSKPADQVRIAEPHADDRMIGGIPMYDPRVAGRLESGGGGLVSSVGDYARFLQMLLNGGELDGVRILSRQSVTLMTSDRLDRIGPGKYYLPGPGYGFGLGFAVRRSPGGPPPATSIGEYHWGGAGGTFFFVDPKQDLFVVYMMQSPRQRLAMRALVRGLVYEAIENSKTRD
ncbi:MAG: serine hydrolase domain-containing protein [Burkholderiaceae bacterium]